MFENIKLSMHFLSTRHYAKHMRKEILKFDDLEKEMKSTYSTIASLFGSDKEFLDLLQLFEELEKYLKEAGKAASDLFAGLEDDQIIQSRALKGLVELDKALQKVKRLNKPEGVEEVNYEAFSKTYKSIQDFIERLKNESRDFKRDSELWRDIIVLPEEVIKYKAKALAWHERNVAKDEAKKAEKLRSKIDELQSFFRKLKSKRTNLSASTKSAVEDAKVDMRRLNKFIEEFSAEANLEFDELATIERYLITLLFHLKDNVQTTKKNIVTALKNRGIHTNNSPSIFNKMDHMFEKFDQATLEKAKENYYLQLTISHHAK